MDVKNPGATLGEGLARFLFFDEGVDAIAVPGMADVHSYPKSVRADVIHNGHVTRE